MAAERQRVALACEECGARNYKKSKPRRSDARLALKKFCPHCKRHTIHRESK